MIEQFNSQLPVVQSPVRSLDSGRLISQPSPGCSASNGGLHVEAIAARRGLFGPSIVFESDNGAGSTAPAPAAPSAPVAPDTQSGGSSNSWTSWAQQQLGGLFSQAPAPTAPPAPAPTPQPAPTAPANQAPPVDANGFPTDPNFVLQQWQQNGVNPVDLNREFVTQQEQLAALQQVLSDPAQRAEFFAELDRQNGGGQQPTQPGQQQQQQRPNFPGGAPGQQQQLNQQDLQGYYQQMQNAARTGYPIDNLQASYQMWDQIPDAAWQALAGTLIQGDY